VNKGFLPEDVFQELENIQNLGECPAIWDLRDLSREAMKEMKFLREG
ncbi:MAG TPA: hypothetical protein IAB84_08600, partial [Candidatus Choladousia intestinigallinarum]|nr:hypothetical protein [Candidatus Choladousia intestinigallinarum]